MIDDWETFMTHLVPINQAKARGLYWDVALPAAATEVAAAAC
jgi:hypothetical protein